MAVSGSWAARNFTGASKWGTGINPVHAIRDQGRGRQYGLHQPVPGHDLQPAPEELMDHEDWGYCAADYYGGEAEAGVRAVYDRPGWGEHVNRDDIPSDWPETGERQSAAGSAAFHAVPHESQEEAGRAVAVFREPVNGGWLNKARGEVNRPVTSHPRQYEINTSWVQGAGIGVMRNERAVARGTDDPRSEIQSRDAGMVVKSWAKSYGMGGGPGAPDMRPYQQSSLKRPFYFRTPGLPPAEVHSMNTIEGRQPLAYVAPDNPDTGSPATQDPADGYGYAEGDYF
jgi:hypothetical protein